MRTTTKIAAVLGGSALAVATAGTAYAYWTTTGGGTGTGSTAAGATSALAVAGDVANAMYPGDAQQTVTATVTNNGTESYQLQAVKAYVTTNKAGCTGADYLLNNSAAPSTLATAVDLGFAAVNLAHNGTATKTFTMQFNNTNANQDACKSATVTINYVAS